MRFLTLLIGLAIGLGSGVHPAYPHDADCHGNPVPSYIKMGCCGAGDAYQLKAGEWRERDGGGYQVLLDGNWVSVIDFNGKPMEPMPSDDGCDWVWYRRQGADGYWHDHVGIGQYRFYCLQLYMAF